MNIRINTPTARDLESAVKQREFPRNLQQKICKYVEKMEEEKEGK